MPRLLLHRELFEQGCMRAGKGFRFRCWLLNDSSGTERKNDGFRGFGPNRKGLRER